MKNVGKINDQYVGVTDKGEIFASEHWHSFSRRLKEEIDNGAFSTKVDNRKAESGVNADQETGKSPSSIFGGGQPYD